MPNRTIYILYIDDDPGLFRLVQKRLLSRGHVVELATDVGPALKRIEDGNVDVIALDHYLPSGTGLDVLAVTSALGLPVVYVTASSDAATAVSALKAGAYDYVLKTVDDNFLDLLVTAIDQAVERSRLIRSKEAAEAELRIAKERAEMLLKEVNHRVSNSLAIVAAMVRLQAGSINDAVAKQAFDKTQARISAIASVHRSLYTSHDVRFVNLKEYLGNLIQEIGTSFGAGSVAPDILLCLDELDAPTDVAVSLGVITAELVTNAVKYAYPDEPGEVRVSLRSQETGEVILMVEDDGIGRPENGEFKGTGLGSKLINSLASSISASLAYHDTTPGTRAVVTLELGTHPLAAA